MSPGPDRSDWPAHVRPGALRFVRASSHYDETIAFYRDLVGLPVIGEFSASFGEDGTIFGLPDTGVQMEVVRDDRDVPAGPFDQLVLYVSGPDAVDAATAPLRAAGARTIDPHPYWVANGAVVYRDPDGRGVVYAPWVYGREPSPTERTGEWDEVRVEWYDGDRAAIRWLFEEAEDSARLLDAYIDAGRVLVARRGADIVGHLQLIPAAAEEVELKNMAVAPGERGTGVGRLLVGAAVAASVAEGTSRMLVSTAAADAANLRFYQRCGFRVLSVERDAFTPATGYPEPIHIDGIPLRDRVWLDRDLAAQR